MPRFKVGDKLYLNDPGAWWHGKRAVVTTVFENPSRLPYGVRIEGDRHNTPMAESNLSDRVMPDVQPVIDTDSILAKFRCGEQLDNWEAHALVDAGLAYDVYDDPDSNRPTGFVVDRLGDGKAHADWETEEELAHLGL